MNVDRWCVELTLHGQYLNRFISRSISASDFSILDLLSNFPRRRRPPHVSSLRSCHTPPGPGAATDAMPALTRMMPAFILHPAEISALLGTGGHRSLPVADRVVGPGRNEVNGAGVQAALGHRSLKSTRCKRGRGTIVDQHQTKRFISHLRNTEV